MSQFETLPLHQHHPFILVIHVSYTPEKVSLSSPISNSDRLIFPLLSTQYINRADAGLQEYCYRLSQVFPNFLIGDYFYRTKMAELLCLIDVVQLCKLGDVRKEVAKIPKTIKMT